MQQQATGGPSDPADTAPASARLVQREASDHVLAIGLRKAWIGDLYHQMLSLPWAPFPVGLSLVYLGLNLLFALAYLLGDGAIANARRGAFLDAFFFSVETLSTIGYGQMSPEFGRSPSERQMAGSPDSCDSVLAEVSARAASRRWRHPRRGISASPT